MGSRDGPGPLPPWRVQACPVWPGSFALRSEPQPLFLGGPCPSQLHPLRVMLSRVTARRRCSLSLVLRRPLTPSPRSPVSLQEESLLHVLASRLWSLHPGFT